jgi:iron(III) transport system substrate-binding protein
MFWIIQRNISAFAFAIAMALGGITAAVAQQTSDAVQANLYAKAQKEGILVWYGTTLPDVLEVLVGAFEQKYPGIKVKTLRAIGSDLLQRLATEKRAGIPSADVIALGDPDIEKDLFSKGMVDRYIVADYDKYPKSFKGDPTVGVVFDKLTIVGPIVFNTSRMRRSDVPASLVDFAKLDAEKFRGKIIMLDPRATLSGLVGVTFIDEAAGRQALKAIGDLRPVVQASSTVVNEGIISGEYWITPTFNMQVMSGLQAAGAPLDFVVPKEGVWTIPSLQMLVSKAPHRNAARLWLEWLYSAEGQKVITRQGYYSGHADVPVARTMAWMNGVKIADLDLVKIQEDRGPLLEEYGKILGLK